LENKIRILIVEDETLVSFDLKNIVCNLGYEVIGVVRTGEEAFSKAFEAKPDIVLMDIMLSGKLNGIETAEQIKKSIDVPIIYLTAYADKETLHDAKLTEPYGYIIKPFDERSIHSAIEIALYKFKMEMKLRESEKRYRLLAEKLKSVSESKDQFFSLISHELRSPFNSILGFAEILYNDYEELSKDELKLYINSLFHSSKHIFSLLDNLLHLSRFQSGKVDFNPVSISLQNIIEKNLQVLKVTANRKEISIISNLPDNINIFADEAMVNSVLLNLITNAIKFTRRGGKIEINVQHNAKFAEVSVHDHGIGMSDDTIFNLFKVEMSKTLPGTEGETGTGLGLVLTKKFIEQNGGTLKIQSKLHQGSIFTFTIPIVN
jgi:signal transduction histidine kinase